MTRHLGCLSKISSNNVSKKDEVYLLKANGKLAKQYLVLEENELFCYKDFRRTCLNFYINMNTEVYLDSSS